MALPVLPSPLLRAAPSSWELGCSLILTLVTCGPVLELLARPAALPQTSLRCSLAGSCHLWPQLTVGPLTTPPSPWPLQLEHAGKTPEQSLLGQETWAE